MTDKYISEKCIPPIVHGLMVLMFIFITSLLFSCRSGEDNFQERKTELSRSYLIVDPKAIIMDSLINTNRIEEAVDYYKKIHSGQQQSMVQSYLIYKLNKSIFFHNYFYPCETLEFVPFDSHETPFFELNRHYALNKLFDEDTLKDVLLSFVQKYRNDPALVSEMLSEIGRYYMFEGNHADSADVYFSRSLETTERAQMASQNDLLTQRALVYVQIAIRKDHKAMAYAENLFKRVPPGYLKRKDGETMQTALRAFCYHRLSNNKMGDQLFDRALALSDSIPCTYHQQEVYKLLLSIKSYFSDDQEDIHWVQKLDSIVSVDGDFCNFGKVKGEFYLWRNVDLGEAKKYLEMSIPYILNHKPINNLQIYTAMYALYRAYFLNDEFDEALDFYYSMDYDKSPGKRFTFSLEEALSPRMMSKRYYYINLEIYAKSFLGKYRKYRNNEDLLLAHRIIQLADQRVHEEFKSFDDQILLIIYNSSRDVYETGAAITLELFTITQNETYFTDYLYWQEKNRSRILYRDLRMKENDDANSQALYILEQEYRKKINGFQRYQQWDSLMVYSKKLDVLFANFYRVAGKEMVAEKEKISEIQSLRNLLKPGQIYLDFHFVEGRPGLIYLDAHRYGIKTWPFDDNFQEKIRTITGMLEGELQIDADMYQETASYLYKMLLEEVLDGHSSVLYTCHHGFSRLNPETWIKEPLNGKAYKDLNYLLYDYEWERIESIYLVKDADNPVTYNRCLAYFYTDEKSIYRSTQSIRELPGNLIERNVIENIFEDARISSGTRCTKSRFFEDLRENADVLHISVHGHGSDEVRSNTYLLFRDGVLGIDTLYSDELLNFHFPPLVLLTACESGKGTYVAGEGTFSLARYFIQGGSQKVIRSLWDLDDTAAGLLVANFYQHLQTSQDPVWSLREAKRSLIHQYPNFANPYFWGGLI